jgi:hypothetical protein
MRRFVLEFSIGSADSASKEDVARYWFSTALDRLRPGLIDALDAQPSLPLTDDPLPEELVGGYLASITWKSSRGERGSGVSGYSPAHWRKFIAKLGEDYSRVALTVYTIASPTALSYPYFEAKVQIIPEDPDWVQAVVATAVEDFDEVGVSKAWTDFAFDAANALSPIFAHTTEDVEDLRTLHEKESRLFPFETLPSGQAKLRGHSWMTVISSELVAKLGGLRELQESGVFYKVLELSAGGAFLQATEFRQDYSSETRDQIDRFFRPVLI